MFVTCDMPRDVLLLDALNQLAVQEGPPRLAVGQVPQAQRGARDGVHGLARLADGAALRAGEPAAGRGAGACALALVLVLVLDLDLDLDLDLAGCALARARARALVLARARAVVGVRARRAGAGAVAVKVSMRTFVRAGWEVPGSEARAAVAGLLHEVVQLFGARRVMFASNYPVDRVTTPGGLAALYNAFRELAARYSPEEQRQMFHDAAARAYGLPEAAEAAEAAPAAAGGGGGAGAAEPPLARQVS
jgi:hypothetical protein